MCQRVTWDGRQILAGQQTDASDRGPGPRHTFRVKRGGVVLYLLALAVTTALLVRFLYLDGRPWYGNWPAVILSALFFSLFMVGFLVALPRRDWRQAALGPGIPHSALHRDVRYSLNDLFTE